MIASAIIASAIIAAGSSAGAKVPPKTKCTRPQAPANESTIPVSAPSAPRRAYSESRIRAIWRLVAPSVLSSTPSRRRSRRVAATALNSTGMPIARLNSARKRTATETFLTMSPIVRRTSERSMLEMFGNRTTLDRWRWAIVESDSTAATVA